jgi:flagellar hook-associated protein 2
VSTTPTTAIGGTQSSSNPLSIGGLASGLDTTAIISALMAIDSQPLARMKVQQAVIQTRQSLLQGIQTQLSSLQTAAQGLASPTTFATTQSVTSSDTTKIVATLASGAGVGGHVLTVGQMANSAQRTFTFASPAAGDTVTIDGHNTTLAANASIQDFVSAVNSDASATVYAAAVDGTTVVLSNRSSGDTGAGFIAVTDAGGSLVEQPAKARQGQDAQYTVDGVAGTSKSNVITDAIVGVQVTLQGITTSPVTVAIGAPAPSTDAITQKLTSFVTLYNQTVDAINGQLTQQPIAKPQSTADALQGTLYADPDLSDLLSRMRQAIYTPIAGKPSGMASLADIGISTGDASGAATPSASALAGHLTIDTAKLTQALQTNPQGVQQMLGSVTGGAGFMQAFVGLMAPETQAGGVLDTRINGSQSNLSDIANQMQSLQALLDQRQTALRAQFANLEATLSQAQSQGQWLSSQIAGLP